MSCDVQPRKGKLQVVMIISHRACWVSTLSAPVIVECRGRCLRSTDSIIIRVTHNTITSTDCKPWFTLSTVFCKHRAPFTRGYALTRSPWSTRVYNGNQWHVHWSWATMTSVSTWMGRLPRKAGHCSHFVPQTVTDYISCVLVWNFSNNHSLDVHKLTKKRWA